VWPANIGHPQGEPSMSDVLSAVVTHIDPKLRSVASASLPRSGWYTAAAHPKPRQGWNEQMSSFQPVAWCTAARLPAKHRMTAGRGRRHTLTAPIARQHVVEVSRISGRPLVAHFIRSLPPPASPPRTTPASPPRSPETPQ
jgi:hypothetical protein